MDGWMDGDASLVGGRGVKLVFRTLGVRTYMYMYTVYCGVGGEGEGGLGGITLVMVGFGLSWTVWLGGRWMGERDSCKWRG